MNNKTEKTPTVYDVAKLAGVSPSTVTRVIKNNPSVNEKAKQKVQSAISQLHYSKSKKTVKKDLNLKTIGLIIPDISNPFFSLLIKGIEKAAKVQGYHIILCDSENDIELEKKHIQDFLDRGISGLICTPVPGINPLFSKLVADKFSFVLLDRVIPLDQVSCVYCNNFEGVYLAARYLLDLGHQQILYVGDARDSYPDQERFSGFKKALAEENIPVKDELIIYGRYDWDIAYHEMNRFLKKEITFTAALVTNDMMAYGIKKALAENNLHVPGDISLIGYDDIHFSSLIGLTTVFQPGYEMGRNAMLLLIDLIQGRIKHPQQIVLRTSLMIRESCKRR